MQPDNGKEKRRKPECCANNLKLGFWKPVVVSHHMLLGLSKPNASSNNPENMLLDMKMSKSRPDSAIFMEDSKKEVERKIAKAFCPEKQVELNPVLEYCRYLVFEKFKKMKIERPAKFGGNLEYKTYAELEADFAAGKLHPADLKNATAFYINDLLEPVRKHFSKGKVKGLLEQVQAMRVTR